MIGDVTRRAWAYLSRVAEPPCPKLAGVKVRDRPDGHPPMVLWVLVPARLDEVVERSAAIVGTRAATVYGKYAQIA